MAGRYQRHPPPRDAGVLELHCPAPGQIMWLSKHIEERRKQARTNNGNEVENKGPPTDEQCFPTSPMISLGCAHSIDSS